MDAKSRRFALPTSYVDGIQITTRAHYLLAGVIIPLMCIVDYHGFRVLAVAKVPIDTPVFTSSGKLRHIHQDMVHGTPDGGHTILNESRALNSKLQDIAGKLNLSMHSVKVKETRRHRRASFCVLRNGAVSACELPPAPYLGPARVTWVILQVA